MMKREMETKKNEKKHRHKRIRMSVETNLDKAFPIEKRPTSNTPQAS